MGSTDDAVGLVSMGQLAKAVRACVHHPATAGAGPLDLRGFILVTIGLGGLVFGFSAIGRGVLPPFGIELAIGGGAVCAVLYLLHARRTANPIVDLSLLRIRTFKAAIIGGSLFFVGTVSSVFLLALLLQLGFGLSAFQAGAIRFASAVGSLMMRLTAHMQPITETKYRPNGSPQIQHSRCFIATAYRRASTTL